MKLLIAIPVFNEQQYLSRVLDKVLTFHSDVLVIDDGSSDDTPKLLANRADVHVIRHERNLGYGQSLIDAFSFAEREGFEWVITMDCDEQHEPEIIPKFVELIQTNHWDIISGSRYLKTDSEGDLPPTDRRMINANITGLVNALFDLRITDAFCGFKAHRVSATQMLKLDESGYAFPLQLWPRVAAAGLRVTELPVRLIYNDPNRHFGGNLDDAGNRLKHYLEVFEREVRQIGDQRKCAALNRVACCS